MAKSNKNMLVDFEHLIIPSTIGGVIAWVFSGNVILGVIVFVAVWIGNWIGSSFFKKK